MKVYMVLYPRLQSLRGVGLDKKTILWWVVVFLFMFVVHLQLHVFVELLTVVLMAVTWSWVRLRVIVETNHCCRLVVWSYLYCWEYVDVLEEAKKADSQYIYCYFLLFVWSSLKKGTGDQILHQDPVFFFLLRLVLASKFGLSEQFSPSSYTARFRPVRNRIASSALVSHVDPLIL